MTKDEALDLALEALEMVVVDVKTTPTAYEAHRQAITAIKQARSAPVQPEFPQCAEDLSPKTLVYTAKQVERMLTTPPAAQRQWVGLTDEQIDKLFGDGPYVPAMLLRDVARAIEAKLKEKNT